MANLRSFGYADGLHPFLSHWGGEMIYFHAGTAAVRGAIDALEKASFPAIVEFAVPYDLVESYCRDHVAKGMVAALLDLPYVAEAHVYVSGNHGC